MKPQRKVPETIYSAREYRDLEYGTLHKPLSTFLLLHLISHAMTGMPLQLHPPPPTHAHIFSPQQPPPSSLLYFSCEINGLEGLDDPPHPLQILIINHRL